MCYYSMTVKVTHNEHRETETTALYFTMSTSYKDRGIAELLETHLHVAWLTLHDSIRYTKHFARFPVSDLVAQHIHEIST
jgi:hypothetical protein